MFLPQRNLSISMPVPLRSGIDAASAGIAPEISCNHVADSSQRKYVPLLQVLATEQEAAFQASGVEQRNLIHINFKQTFSNILNKRYKLFF